MVSNDNLNKLALAFADRVKQKELNLKVAESFTGGLILASLVQIEGASTFLSEGIVCYNNESKILRLGARQESLNEFGAVSYSCVRQMLNGLAHMGADIAIATSGNAGPTSSGGEVGVCYIGVYYNKKTVIQKLKINGDRKAVIFKGAELALNLAATLLGR